MCDEVDDYNDVQTSKRVRARVEHRCCACKERIRPGDEYERTFVVYDGNAESFKHCLRCIAMIDALGSALPPETSIAWRLDCGENWLDTIGALPDHVAELAFITPDEAQSKFANGSPTL
jgi:hypothetical protein